MNTVCLCGSTKFLDDFNTANIELTKRGLTVITISMSLPRQPNGEHEEGLKNLLDLVHLNKILRSDGIFVVGYGYLGRSTAREILWTHMQRKFYIRQFFRLDVASPLDWDTVEARCRTGIQENGLLKSAKEKLGV